MILFAMRSLTKIPFTLIFSFVSLISLHASGREIALETLVLKSYDIKGKTTVRGAGVECVGLTPAMQRPLKKRLEHFLGEQISRELIEKIKHSIYKIYQDKQRPIVFVQVPSQNVKSGILVFLITEATAGDVTFEGNKWTKTSTLEGMFQLEPDEPINQQLLLNNIEFLNKNPFRSTRVTYRPGDKVGTTDITLYVDEKKPYRIYVGANNNGIPDTQLARIYTGLTLGNCFSRGQVFTGQFTTSADFKDLLSGTAAYMIPLPKRQLLSLFGGYSSAHSSSIPNVMNNTGYSWQVSSRYTFPLNTSDYYAHEVLVGFDFKRLNNTIEFVSTFPITGQTVTISELVLSYFGSYRRGCYFMDFDASGYYSPGEIFNGQSKSAYRTLNPFANANFFYIRLSQVNTLALPRDYLFKLTLKGQVSTGTLLAPEAFGLGGDSTVRGYYERTLNGDNAFLLRSELFSPSTSIFSRRVGSQDDLRFLGFLDYGLASNWNQVGSIDKNNYLLGLGLGMRYRWREYMLGGFDYGFRVHKDDLPGGLGRPYVSFQLSY